MAETRNELDDLLGSDNEDDGNTQKEIVENDESETAKDPVILSKKKVQKSILDDSDDDDVDAAKTTQSSSAMDNIFGSDDENDDVVKEEKKNDDNPFVNEAPTIKTESSKLDDLFGDDGSNNNKKIVSYLKSEITLAQPLLSTTATANSNIQKAMFLRTPNFIKIQTNGFIESKHDGALEKEQFDGATAIMRWKMGPGAVPVSNSRLIKWSDGTVQLVVGNSVFNAKDLPADNCYLFEQQPCLVTTSNGSSETKKTLSLECLLPMKSRMTLQPTSLDSETHARMSVQIAEKYKKEKKISIQDLDLIKQNPDKELHQRAKQEEDLIRKEQRQHRQQQGTTGGSRRPGFLDERRIQPDRYDYDDDEGIDYGEEEEDDNDSFIDRDYDAAPPKASGKGKKKRKGDEAEEGDEREDFIGAGSDDDEGIELGSQDTEDDEDEEDEEEEGVGDLDDDDDDMVEIVEKKKSKKGKKRRQTESDTEENTAAATGAAIDDGQEEDEFVPQRKKAKKGFIDSDDEN